MDKSALSYTDDTKVELQPSQTDMKKGFGGKFGVQEDRKDTTAGSYNDMGSNTGYQKTVAQGSSEGSKNLRARFEQMAKGGEEEARKKAMEERQKREAKDKADREEQERQKQERLSRDRAAEEEERKACEAAQPPREPSPEPVRQPSPEPVRQPSPVRQPEPVYEPEPVQEPEPVAEPQQEEEGDGLTAIALYDYQASDADELTFDPEEIITNIEQIDEGWWRGKCRGIVGLFPANYVELQQ